jgi:hypothetical protein
MQMAGLERGGLEADEDDYFDMAALWRLALWGVGAGCALVIAAFAAYSDPGIHRLRTAFSSEAVPAAAPTDPLAAPTAVQLVQRSKDAENEAKRLAETVRSLTADRDRLAARLDTIERNLSDVTGAISRERAPSSQPAPQAASQIASPMPWPPANVTAPPISWPPPAGAVQSTNRLITSAVPLRDTPPAELAGPKREYAVDLGGASTMNGLRALWESTKSRNPALLENLRAVAAVRDAPQTGSVELRLLVGPLMDVSAAVRLCAALGPTGLICQPAIFDGQRLASR